MVYMYHKCTEVIFYILDTFKMQFILAAKFHVKHQNASRFTSTTIAWWLWLFNTDLFMNQTWSRIRLDLLLYSLNPIFFGPKCLSMLNYVLSNV